VRWLGLRLEAWRHRRSQIGSAVPLLLQEIIKHFQKRYVSLSRITLLNPESHPGAEVASVKRCIHQCMRSRAYYVLLRNGRSHSGTGMRFALVLAFERFRLLEKDILPVPACIGYCSPLDDSLRICGRRRTNSSVATTTVATTPPIRHPTYDFS